MNALTYFMTVSLGAAEETAASAPGLYERFGALVDRIFMPVFEPTNVLFAWLDPWAQWITAVYFLATWIWVAFILKKEYVNLSCPYKTRLVDLRFWTLVAMAPTLFVYLYFT